MGETQIRQCPYCGQLLPTDSIFCEKCGKKLPIAQMYEKEAPKRPDPIPAETPMFSAPPTPTAYPKPQPKPKKTSPGLVIGVAAIAAAAAVGIFFLRQKPPVPEEPSLQMEEPMPAPEEPMPMPEEPVPEDYPLPQIVVWPQEEARMTVEQPEPVYATGAPFETETFSGSSSEEGDVWSFTAQTTGIHYLEMEDATDGLRLEIIVEDSSGEILLDSTHGDKYYFGQVKMQAGETYTITAKHFYSSGDYTLKLLRAKKILDLSGTIGVHDSMQTGRQLNRYTFTPTESGVYAFWTSNIGDGGSVPVEVLDPEKGQILQDDFGMTSKVKLKAGTTYEINARADVVLTASDRNTTYDLNIVREVRNLDVTPYTVVENNISHRQQLDRYQITPQTDGRLVCGIEELYEGHCVALTVANDLGEVLAENSFCRNREYLAVDGVEAGETYTIFVEQSDGLGSYELHLRQPMPATVLEAETECKDSFRLPKQQNLYTFTPEQDGTYELRFTELYAGHTLNAKVINRLGENAAYMIGLEMGDTLELPQLQAGETYTIQIEQDEELGEYTFELRGPF